jgi:hypothetical protein
MRKNENKCANFILNTTFFPFILEYSFLGSGLAVNWPRLTISYLLLNRVFKAKGTPVPKVFYSIVILVYPMIKREVYRANVTKIADDLEKLYERYPQFRGKTPNHIVNVAVKEWLMQKLNKGKQASDSPPLRRFYSGFANTANFFVFTCQKVILNMFCGQNIYLQPKL